MDSVFNNALNVVLLNVYITALYINLLQKFTINAKNDACEYMYVILSKTINSNTSNSYYFQSTNN